MKQKMVICFGELLVDMISKTTGNLVDSTGFLKKFGGAPANTAIGLAKLTVPVSFIGKVGNDQWGQFLLKTLQKNAVNTDHVIVDRHERTTLAFVSLTKNGERDFIFFPGAHAIIKTTEVTLPQDTSILHFGSLTQTQKNSYLATEKLISQAKQQCTLLSYDPNYRKTIWESPHHARTIILQTIPKVDILKVNAEEAEFLTGVNDEKKAAEQLFLNNLEAVIVTLGERGCYYMTAAHSGYISAPKVKTVDTTGAGDAFNAGFLAGIYSSERKISLMSKDEIEIILKRAVIIAAFTTTKKGAITVFPRHKWVNNYIS